MKNRLLIATGLLAITSSSFCSTIKGSDYISRDVGTKYTFNETTYIDNANKPVKQQLQTIVDGCNDAKSACTSTATTTDATGNTKDLGTLIYKIKDGAVYMVDSNKNDKLIFPADIKLNQTQKIETIASNNKLKNNNKFVKQIPKITINGNDYSNCLAISTDATATTNNGQKVDINSNDVHCKGIGLVKETFKENTIDKEGKTHSIKTVISLSNISKPQT